MRCLPTFLFMSLIYSVSSFAGFSEETAPYQPSGKVDGFKLMVENSKTSLAKAGVKRGDIVIAVNGKPIQSIEDAQRAYSNPTVQEVVVLRNDKPVTLKSKGEAK